MATRFIFSAANATFPSSNFPQFQIIGTTPRRPVLSYDAATNETAYFEAVAPDGWDTTSSPTARIYYFMASAASGDVDVDVQVEAVSDGDTVDLDTSNSFDTANSTDNTTVPGTAGYLDVITVTLTNHDSSAAGDHLRFAVVRDAASDTASGDMHVYKVEIRDAA